MNKARFLWQNKSSLKVFLQLEPWAIGFFVQENSNLDIEYIVSQHEECLTEIFYVRPDFITLYFNGCMKIKIILDGIDVTSKYPYLDRID